MHPSAAADRARAIHDRLTTRPRQSEEHFHFGRPFCCWVAIHHHYSNFKGCPSLLCPNNHTNCGTVTAASTERGPPNRRTAPDRRTASGRDALCRVRAPRRRRGRYPETPRSQSSEIQCPLFIAASQVFGKSTNFYYAKRTFADTDGWRNSPANGREAIYEQVDRNSPGGGDVRPGGNGGRHYAERVLHIPYQSLSEPATS